jgi:hypothetical protein
MENFLNKNEVVVVGTLVENGLEIKESQGGQTYITGNIAVKSVLDGEEQVFEFRLFSFQFKKGTTEVNGLFKTYASLDTKIGKRVKVIGGIEDNRFFQERTGQIVSFNFNAGRFIYDVTDKTPDSATFEFAGYVDKPIHEKTNKDGEVLHYEISLGQANYNGTKPVMVKFQVPATNRKAVTYMERNYEKGVTITVNGNLKVDVEKVTKEEEVAFGDPIVKEYINTFKAYQIVSGSEPIYGRNEYPASKIREFANIYEDEGIEIQNKAKDKVKVEAKSDAKKTSATSLL